MAPTHLIARASSGRPHSPPARPRDEYTKAPRPRRRARIQPLAVMVEAKHALVAEPAVLRRREHVDLAEVAAARVLADRRRPQRQRLATPGEAIRCRRRRGGDAGVAGVDGRGDPSAEEGRRRGGRVHRPHRPARRLAGKQRQQQPVEVEEDDREQGPGQALQRMQRIVEAVLAHSRNAASRQDHLCSVCAPRLWYGLQGQAHGMPSILRVASTTYGAPRRVAIPWGRQASGSACDRPLPPWGPERPGAAQARASGPWAPLPYPSIRSWG